MIEQGRIIRDVDVQAEIFTTLKTEQELAKIEQVEENSIVMFWIILNCHFIKLVRNLLSI